MSFIITFGTLEVVSSRSHLAGISCRRVIISEADRFSSAKVYASGWCPSVCLCLPLIGYRSISAGARKQQRPASYAAIRGTRIDSAATHLAKAAHRTLRGVVVLLVLLLFRGNDGLLSSTALARFH